jgi:hypothetical protein
MPRRSGPPRTSGAIRACMRFSNQIRPNNIQRSSAARATDDRGEDQRPGRCCDKVEFPPHCQGAKAGGG